jgi:16S rRNA (uracil1498-N3)-methyltransferase
MELFYSKDISEGGRVLDAEESGHCVRVLRHRRGDQINVVDGHGLLYRCTIVDDDPRGVLFDVDEWVENYGTHDYWLRMAVCPPKNIDRFEWFAEKATEIGVDVITPIFGDYSERRVLKPERLERLLVAAAKQSHKGAIPHLDEPLTVTDFLQQDHPGLKLICYCDDAVGKVDIKEALLCYSRLTPESLGAAGERRPSGAVTVLSGQAPSLARNGSDCAEVSPQSKPEITVMIGPEGDFSRAEVALALERGWQPVSLGDSRLRIETAALVATAAVYLNFFAT